MALSTQCQARFRQTIRLRCTASHLRSNTVHAHIPRATRCTRTFRVLLLRNATCGKSEGMPLRRPSHGPARRRHSVHRTRIPLAPTAEVVVKRSGAGGLLRLLQVLVTLPHRRRLLLAQLAIFDLLVGLGAAENEVSHGERDRAPAPRLSRQGFHQRPGTGAQEHAGCCLAGQSKRPTRKVNRHQGS